MGRNFIAERTIVNPGERAIAQRKKQEAARKRKAREAKSLEQYLARAKFCRAEGCQNEAIGGEQGWWPCCSESCHARWSASLESGNSAPRKRKRRVFEHAGVS